MKEFIFRKRWIAIAATFVLVTIAGGGLSSAIRSVPMTADEAAMWVAAFSSERLSVNSSIRLELTDSVRDLYPDIPLDNVLEFSPSVRGELRLTGRRTLEFVPRIGALKAGREYACRVRMSKLTGVDSLRDFVFRFSVAERKSQLEVMKVRVDPADTGCMQVEGRLTFSEPIDAAAVSSHLLHCDVNGTSAQVKVTPTENPAVFRFYLTRLRRAEREVRMHVSFNARELEFDDPEPQQIVVPGIREYKLLSAERHNAAQPYIELEFSAPLSASQELDGLIVIDRIERVRIERQGANVKVFYEPNGLTELTLRISELLRSADGQLLSGDIEQHFEQEVIPPAVEIPLNGTILPDDCNLRLPFRAVNLAAVDVEVVKIYAENMLHFLQGNELDETSRMRRAGRLIYRKTVRLDGDPSLNLHEWQNFSIDLKNLFRQERGAVYNIRLAFRRAYSLYDRSAPDSFDLQEGLTREDRDTWDRPRDYIERSAPDYDWRNYKWRERDDPSKATYYMVDDRMPEYNLAASDIGLIVKRADGDKLWCVVSNLLTAAPWADVRVTAYNYQLCEIGSACTDGQGFADFAVTGNPYVVTASNGTSTTYLKINGGSELSTSRFDVGGRKSPQSIKGFVYGERGVWRPGDEVHLTLMVEDRQRTLPGNYPVTMELYTPSEQLYERQTLAKGVDGIYVFHTRTADDAPTGQWDARFKVGGQTFHHPVRIETIKPNRLKIDISSPDVLCGGDLANIGLEAHWLTGPAANGLNAKVEMALYNNPQPFERYADFVFSNPLYAFACSTDEVLSGQLDSLGRISGSCRLVNHQTAPGMLQANLLARVAEAGGDESLTSRSVRYSPYESYVGIRLDDREFETDCDLRFPVVTLDAEEQPLSERELEYKIYKLGWSWWWEGSACDLSRYVQSTSAEVVASGTLTTSQGKAEVPFRIDYPAWGKYLVFVRDTKSAHATGGVIFIDWPDWRGHSGKSDPTAASMLSFALDKRSYEAGDEAVVYLPKTSGGRVLLSVENGSRVLSRCWVRTSAEKETAYKLPVTKEMAPNFYVHATLLQPHAQTANDLPIRMYGIEGAEVIDRRTMLHPEIEVADEIRPQQEFTIRVRERDGKPMSYTLAIVDEGLLDITSFKTPQPWRTMYRREALGVRTWDMYDDVIGAFTERFTPILSIGGDEALRRAAGKEKRFRPVAKFLGPFTLPQGTETHRIQLPMYVGSVRVMVVAAHDGCYGNADKTVAVRAPLMLLPTLPRTLACGDRLKMPVNLFATGEGIRNVKISVASEGPVAVAGDDVQTLRLEVPAEKMTEFELCCDPTKNGQATVTITATDGAYRVCETVHIDVRNPLPDVVEVQRHRLSGSDEHRFAWKPFTEGQVRLEIASIPSIDFAGAFSFVENYAHLCTEQLSSRAMYMLYARRFLDDEARQRADKALPALLRMLLSRQLADGGFAYWPGRTKAHDWATSMAGEAMIEARRQGFAVASQALERWVGYQQMATRKYRHTTEHAADLKQAYRLYTLVLAEAEPVAAMNKLRESKSLSQSACYRLAAAYALVGRRDVAASLIGRAHETAVTKGDCSTFWSELRDRAMALETYALADRSSEMLKLAAEVADRFSATCCTTQEVAFVSAAMNRLAEPVGEAATEIAVVRAGGRPQTLRNLCGVWSTELDPNTGTVSLCNGGDKAVFVSLMTSRRPDTGEKLADMAEDVTLAIRYTDSNGMPVSVDCLRQGGEFEAQIEVHKTGASDSQSMALTFAVPSGWEIWNDRLAGGPESSDVDFIDIRDECVRWYFSLDAGATRRFTVRLRAAYCGQFVLPPTVCEDMYDPWCRAMTANACVEVVK